MFVSECKLYKYTFHKHKKKRPRGGASTWSEVFREKSLKYSSNNFCVTMVRLPELCDLEQIVLSFWKVSYHGGDKNG